MRKAILILTAALSLIMGVHADVGDSVTSPDGKWIVYVTKGSGPPIDTGLGDMDPEELWQMDSHGKNRTLLMRTHNSPNGDMRYVVAGFSDMKFSADGRLVYFTTPAYAVSGAVHVVNTTNCKENFVVNGTLNDVLHSPKGDLLVVGQKRYDKNGGYWRKYLFTPDGTEIGPVSDIER